MERRALAWALWGIPIVFCVGAVAHFVFEWCGCWTPLALVFAVNESVWEHHKLSVWPGLVYALLEWRGYGRGVANFWTAKAAALLLMPVVVDIGFYTYTPLVGHPTLWVDITLFFVGITVGMLVGYRLVVLPTLSVYVRRIGLGLLVALVTCFLLFTFFPPRLGLFRDCVTGCYGIPPGQSRHE